VPGSYGMKERVKDLVGNMEPNKKRRELKGGLKKKILGKWPITIGEKEGYRVR